jgi:hypothetical protein
VQKRHVVLVRRVEQLVVPKLLVRLHVDFVKHKKLLKQPKKLLV